MNDLRRRLRVHVATGIAAGIDSINGGASIAGMGAAARG